MEKKKVLTAVAVGAATVAAGVGASQVHADSVTVTKQQIGDETKITTTTVKDRATRQQIDQTKQKISDQQNKVSVDQNNVVNDRVDVENAEQNVQKAQSDLNSAKDNNQEIVAQKDKIASQINSITSDLNNSKENLSNEQVKQSSLYNQVSSDQQRVNSAQAAQSKAESAKNAAQSKVDSLEKQGSAQDIVNAQNQVNQAQINVNNAMQDNNQAQNALQVAQQKDDKAQAALKEAQQAAKGPMTETDDSGHVYENVHATAAQEREWDNGVTLNEAQQQILDQLNLARLHFGLPPVYASASLNTCAQNAVQACFDKGVSHDSTEQAREPITAGFQLAPGHTMTSDDETHECLASRSTLGFDLSSNYNDRNAGALVRQWLDEDNGKNNHRANLLDPNFKYVGIGFGEKNQIIASLEFVGPRQGANVLDSAYADALDDTDLGGSNSNITDNTIYTGKGAVTPLSYSEENPTPYASNSSVPQDVIDAANQADADLATAKENAESAQSRLTSAQKQLDIARNNLSNIEQSSGVNSEALAQAQKELNQSNKDYQVAHQAYLNAEAQLLSDQNKLNSINDDIQNLDNQIANDQNNLDILNKKLTDLNQNKPVDMSSLQQSVNDAQDALSKAQQKYDIDNQEYQNDLTLLNELKAELLNEDPSVTTSVEWIKNVHPVTTHEIGDQYVLNSRSSKRASSVSMLKVNDIDEVQAAEVPGLRRSNRNNGLPDTGDSQNNAASVAGLLGLGLAGILSMFGLADRKKQH